MLNTGYKRVKLKSLAPCLEDYVLSFSLVRHHRIDTTDCDGRRQVQHGRLKMQALRSQLKGLRESSPKKGASSSREVAVNARMSSEVILSLRAAAVADTPFHALAYNRPWIRSELIERDAALAIGADVQLSDKEKLVNNILMRRKFREVDEGIERPEDFMYSHHYFTYKDKIKDSKVYEIIRAMPKGALLHVHDMAILGADYLLNITYMDHLYVCFYDSKVQLVFSDGRPTTLCSTRWQLMSDARRAASSVSKFDDDLRKNFSIVIDDPQEVYTDINKVWRVFMQVFSTIAPMLSYRPVWEQYFYDALKAIRDDNIMYVEVRSVLPRLYELDGTEHDELITAKAYRKVTKKFMTDYPDFLGARLIYAPGRHVNRSTVSQYIDMARRIKSDMPEFFAGFDLVGQEDLGAPLLDFLSELEGARGELNYFFHAGETPWWRAPADDDLVDAILLGARRLGHGYSLSKRPILMEEVQRRGIGLEVAVLSNSVLGLLNDPRNHPLSGWIARGLPVVLAGDDPGLWGAPPLSHDFQVVFMAVSARTHDLRLMKRLALNSIQYSAMDTRQKDNFTMAALGVRDVGDRRRPRSCGGLAKSLTMLNFKAVVIRIYLFSYAWSLLLMHDIRDHKEITSALAAFLSRNRISDEEEVEHRNIPTSSN
ncbi:Adenosine deaminase 2 [Eumeta japonica]|uniref:Adenosine deaminase n=1 Tax=Eumeta variegata TaxID=151549 RepID=A0A4C1VAP8_EUMVA|nr:Adenosine deaminase 2 [Eumeta japonica]